MWRPVTGTCRKREERSESAQTQGDTQNQQGRMEYETNPDRHRGGRIDRARSDNVVHSLPATKEGKAAARDRDRETDTPTVREGKRQKL
jgi:hypothetical protein